MSLIFLIVTIIAVMVSQVSAGFLTVGACYTACNAGVVACYSAAGLIFGVSVVSGPPGWWTMITGGGAAAAAATCSAAQGVCMAACTATVIAPTP